MQTMHLLPGVAIQPNLELKTRPKPVLGSLPLAFALPEPCHSRSKNSDLKNFLKSFLMTSDVETMLSLSQNGEGEEGKTEIML